MTIDAADMTEQPSGVPTRVSDAGEFATPGVSRVPLAGGHKHNFSFSSDGLSVTKVCSIREAGFYIWLQAAAEAPPSVLCTPAASADRNLQEIERSLRAAALTHRGISEGGQGHCGKHESISLRIFCSDEAVTGAEEERHSRSRSSVFFGRDTLLCHFLSGNWWPLSPDASSQARELLRWIPGFLGLEKTAGAECNAKSTEEKGPKGQAVRLINILQGMRRPVTLDLKIGTRTYGDDASPEKRARAIRRAEERGSLTLGLAFSGLSALEEDGRVFCVPGGSRAPAGFQYPKTIADYTKLLRMFLASAGTTEQQCGLAGQFARKATDLSELFARLTVVNLYGSSVLLGYDAAAGNHPFGASTEERDLVSSAELKLIDFAHVSVLPETPDPGFSLGIDNLKTVLKSVITELKQEEAKKSAQ